MVKSLKLRQQKSHKYEPPVTTFVTKSKEKCCIHYTIQNLYFRNQSESRITRFGNLTFAELEIFKKRRKGSVIGYNMISIMI